MDHRPVFGDDRVIAATSLSGLGNMSLSGADAASSLNNRQRFLSLLGIDHLDLVCARQTHSDSIACVDKTHKGKGALEFDDAIDACDAFITSEKGLPLAIFTADCLAVFLYDPKASAVGLAHAGWRGSLENISGKTVRLMCGKFGSDPADLRAGFGPAIGGCCYQVGADLREKFSGAIFEKEGRTYLDLFKVNKEQLIAEGLDAQNIRDDQACTFCGRDYFSYRRQKSTTARMMSVIMLK
jgi:hypothetical protein